MQLTRNGICYNFDKTPYEVTITYDNGQTIAYKFSSQNNIDRFNDKIKENRKKINDSLSKRFKFTIFEDIICDLKLYQTIETRGFLICSNGVFIECLDHIQLNGAEVTKKSLEE